MSGEAPDRASTPATSAMTKGVPTEATRGVWDKVAMSLAARPAQAATVSTGMPISIDRECGAATRAPEIAPVVSRRMWTRTRPAISSNV